MCFLRPSFLLLAFCIRVMILLAVDPEKLRLWAVAASSWTAAVPPAKSPDPVSRKFCWFAGMCALVSQLSPRVRRIEALSFCNSSGADARICGSSSGARLYGFHPLTQSLVLPKFSTINDFLIARSVTTTISSDISAIWSSKHRLPEVFIVIYVAKEILSYPRHVAINHDKRIV
mmetsp:Transcript_8021/g.17400  ORF Transcript_8021/g.17400 Transcript_8021/m.17400 type:complete len:174 (-) Transcript_8021:559-1080(-)